MPFNHFRFEWKDVTVKPYCFVEKCDVLKNMGIACLCISFLVSLTHSVEMDNCNVKNSHRRENRIQKCVQYRSLLV